MSRPQVIEMSNVVIRIAVIRCDPSQFERLRTIMVESETLLRPGIEALPGLLAYYAGEDAAASAFSNISFWLTLEHSQRMGRMRCPNRNGRERRAMCGPAKP